MQGEITAIGTIEVDGDIVTGVFVEIPKEVLAKEKMNFTFKKVEISIIE